MAFDITEFGLRAYLNFVTRWRGERVGADSEGNVYYQERGRRTGLATARGGRRARRWVVFNGGQSDASRVPPEWHGWLHYTYDQPPGEANPLRRPWQLPYQPNQTGTDAAYRPPGSLLRGGERAPSASADYEPWTPS